MLPLLALHPNPATIHAESSRGDHQMISKLVGQQDWKPAHVLQANCNSVSQSRGSEMVSNGGDHGDTRGSQLLASGST